MAILSRIAHRSIVKFYCIQAFARRIGQEHLGSWDTHHLRHDSLGDPLHEEKYKQPRVNLLVDPLGKYTHEVNGKRHLGKDEAPYVGVEGWECELIIK